MFIIKTEPLYQKVLGKPQFYIVGFRGRAFDIELTIEHEALELTFLFEFLAENGEVVSSINVNRASVFAGVLANYPPEMGEDEKKAKAKPQTDSILKALIAGSRLKRYWALDVLATSYGLTLLPIEKQDGKL